MGNSYTTQASVLAETTNDIPASAQALIPGWIQDESRTVDTWLLNYSVPFNDIVTGVPPTPSIIERATRYLVLDRLFRNVGLLRYDEAGRVVDSFRVNGERILYQLQCGEIVISAAELPAPLS